MNLYSMVKRVLLALIPIRPDGQRPAVSRGNWSTWEAAAGFWWASISSRQLRAVSPVRSDNVGASYSWQVLICLGLIVGVSIAMGSYIVHLNARIDKQRELSPVYLHQCGNGRGGFIVYPDGRRSSDDCYPADDLESTSTDQPQDVPGTPREQWLKYILPAVEGPAQNDLQQSDQHLHAPAETPARQPARHI
jgi:hypothetical protein